MPDKSDKKDSVYIASSTDSKKAIEENTYVNRYNGFDTVRVSVVPQRTDVPVKTDSLFKELYNEMYKLLANENGLHRYKKTDLTDDILMYGYANMPSCKVAGIIRQYKTLRVQEKVVYESEIIQPLRLGKHERKVVVHFYLSGDGSEGGESQFNMMEGFKESYFIESPLSDIPYIMLVTSFVFSDYRNNILKEFRSVLQPYYDQMVFYIENLPTVIYNINMNLLKQACNGEFPVNKIHLLIDYLYYLVNNVDFSDENTIGYIRRQIEFIEMFCNWISKWLPFFVGNNSDFSIDKFAKLKNWIEIYELQRHYSQEIDGE